MKLINKILVTAVALSSLVACENLDQDPYNALPLERSFRDVNDAISWHNAFYSSLRGTTISIVKNTDIQSDILNSTITWGNSGGVFHNWLLETGTPDTQSIWGGRFGLIADLNICIEKFPTIPNLSVDDRNTVNTYLGEAYALRAYYYLQLVQRYCVAYSDSNKNTPDLGLPLVLTYDINALPHRATLEQTYDQIFADIERAKTLLANKRGQVGAMYITIDAVNALEAIAALSKQDYGRAYRVASALADSGRYPLVDNLEKLQNVWYKDATDESILQLFVSAPDELPGGFSDYLDFDEQTRTYSPDYIPSQWVIDLYETTDIRKKTYFDERTTLFNGQRYTTTLVVKYPRSLYTRNSYAHAPKVFRIAEQYLIAAEAAYKLGQTADAQRYLNFLRTKRGVAGVTTTGDALFADIKNERLREFAFEGKRLDDLKRWGDEVKRHDPQSLVYVNVSPAENFHTLRKAPTDYRFVWPIPEYDRQINKDVKQKPGY